MNSGRRAGITAALLLILLCSAVIFLLWYVKGKDESEPQEETIPQITDIIENDVSVTASAEDQSSSSYDEFDEYAQYPLSSPSDCQALIDRYAQDHGIDPFLYPVNIVNYLYRTPDALEFVLRYPELIGTEDSPDYPGSVDVSDDFSPVKVPEYYQFDIRWGYKSYAGDIMAVTGGGPTALSMVATYLLKNRDMNPAWTADYAVNIGYTNESGTSWTLIGDGAVGLGIDVTPISSDQDRINRNLDVGNLIVCHTAPGSFGDSDQYIVIVSYSDEGYEIRDPGSPARTRQTWSFDALANAMTGCWVMRIL